MSETTIPDHEISARLAAILPRWRVDGDAIVRTYRTAGWKGALMVATTIGHLAEVAWHHPELTLAYDRVSVRLNTHSAGGITEKDLALAAKIEEVVAWRPDDGILEGTPDDPRHAYLRPEA